MNYQADRAAARQEAINRVTEFLQLNYPCSCDEVEDCTLGDRDEAAAIVEMVEAQFFTDDQKCRHCGEPIYLHEWKWRHTNGMYSCELTAETIDRPRGTRPRAEPR